jgi:hypothetical protein
MRFVMRRARKRDIGIGMGGISVRGGDHRHQRAKSQCELCDAFQHNGHS